MVWWKAVSNTATFGTPGHAFSQATMPSRFAGLWSGASGEHFAMPFFVAAVIFTGAAKSAAPCTTRWPIASTSLSDFRTPHAGSHRIAMTALIAATWLGMGISFTTFSAPALA